MRRPQLPSRRQRLDAAEVSGAVQNLVFGPGRDTPLEEAVAQLHAITRDPAVLGQVLGPYLVHAERSAVYAPAVQMLRAAGADEDAAAAVAAWLRERQQQHGGQLP
jgi:hypothetical protein